MAAIDQPTTSGPAELFRLIHHNRASCAERTGFPFVSFVSVTQSFNTTTSMGRLTLNVLHSFAQFEREVTGERIQGKIAASKKKGMWMGGVVPLGYRVEDRRRSAGCSAR